MNKVDNIVEIHSNQSSPTAVHPPAAGVSLSQITMSSSDYDAQVSMYFARGFLRGAVLQGYDPKAILRQAGIDPSIYHNRSARMSGVQLQKLVITLRDTMDDHYMGFLKVRGKLAMDVHSGLAAVQEETLGQATRQLDEFINAVRDDEIRGLHIPADDDFATLTFQFSGFNRDVNQHLLYLLRMYWGYRFYCWLVGRQIKLTSVSFTASRPQHHFDYNRCFDCEVLFDQPTNSISFSQANLVLPVVRNKFALLDGDYPQKFPDWFSVPGHDQSVANQVEQILIELREDGMFTPSIKLVAEIMHMGRRTLSRKLSKEQLSFQKIRTKVRRELAKKYLLDSDLSIGNIAVKIGFLEPSDLTRAFMRWEGQTPSEFRAQQCRNGYIKARKNKWDEDSEHKSDARTKTGALLLTANHSAD